MALKCAELALAGDGTPGALVKPLEKAGLLNTVPVRRSTRRHVQKRQEGELAAEAAHVAQLSPEEAAARQRRGQLGLPNARH